MNLSGGSKWVSDGDPDHSERYVDCRTLVNIAYRSGLGTINASIGIGLGNGWAEWALLPATTDDYGITMNLTMVHFSRNLAMWALIPPNCVPIGPAGESVLFMDRSVDAYSFQGLDITGLEYSNEGESIVKPDLTAVGYTGTVVMTIVALSTTQPWLLAIGATIGLALEGVSAASHYDTGQPVCRCQNTITNPDHYRLQYANDEYMMIVGLNPHDSASDVCFLKIDPRVGCHCGMTSTKLYGTLDYLYVQYYKNIYTGQVGILVYYIPLATVELTLCMPWFLRG
jgi:hypothetical protein